MDTLLLHAPRRHAPAAYGVAAASCLKGALGLGRQLRSVGQTRQLIARPAGLPVVQDSSMVAHALPPTSCLRPRRGVEPEGCVEALSGFGVGFRRVVDGRVCEVDVSREKRENPGRAGARSPSWSCTGRPAQKHAITENCQLGI